MSHFTKKTSPLVITGVSYVYVAIMALVFYFKGFYESDFFHWGPPIKFFGQDITTQNSFYTLHVIIFIHQIINNCVNSVVYAWIINSVQDPKNKIMEYSKPVCLTIITLFNIYSELDVVFIVAGFTSQISFVVTIIVANIFTSLIINYKYLSEKEKEKTPINTAKLENIRISYNGDESLYSEI